MDNILFDKTLQDEGCITFFNDGTLTSYHPESTEDIELDYDETRQLYEVMKKYYETEED